MRVAYICADPGIPVLGSKGASVHVQQIVRAFRRRGDDVAVYCTRAGDGPHELLYGVPIIEVPVPRADPDAREQAVARASAEIAARVASDGCDLVYERYSLFSDAAVRTGIPAVVEVNAPLIQEQREFRHLGDEAGATAITRALFAGAAVVGCVSAPVAEWAREHGAADPVVAPNGVDTARFAPAQDWEAPLRVVFAGSLKPWHGVDVALEALAGVDGVELTIVGDGPERPALERRAATSGLPVTWTGAVPHTAIPGILTGCHVGIAPYPPHAGDYFSPMKVYEYLAAGLAVVASDCGQLPAIIDSGRTGLLVPAGDAGALRDAMARLRDDRGLAQDLGRAARASAVAEHDWSRTLETMLAALPTTTPPASLIRPAGPTEVMTG